MFDSCPELLAEINHSLRRRCSRRVPLFKRFLSRRVCCTTILVYEETPLSVRDIKRGKEERFVIGITPKVLYHASVMRKESRSKLRSSREGVHEIKASRHKRDIE